MTNYCVHCGREIEDRGHPLIRANGDVWWANWVHAPGGFKLCHPNEDPQWGPYATPLTEDGNGN